MWRRASSRGRSRCRRRRVRRGWRAAYLRRRSGGLFVYPYVLYRPRDGYGSIGTGHWHYTDAANGREWYGCTRAEDWGLGRMEPKTYANQSARVDNAVWHALKQGGHTGPPLRRRRRVAQRI